MSEVKGKIIIIKRNGQDRVTYPLVSNSCLFGSGLDCDIRVQLPSVSERHCVLKVGSKDKVYLSSLSHGNITLLNNIPVSSTVPVNHKDILTVVDRCFRFEYPPKSAHYIDVNDPSISAPEVKSLKVLSPREKPPLFQVNGTPGKTPSSIKKKITRKSVGSAVNIHNDGVSPLSHPRKIHNKRNSHSPRSLALSAKRKRVSFGPALSPEQFDKNMPPATPVRRGSLPRRHVTTPDYFGSPIITQYPRSKTNRLSVVPKEQSIPEVVETPSPEALKQSPRNKCDSVSLKSQSPSRINKSSPKSKGSPVQMLQQEKRQKSSEITRKSPLAKKSLQSAFQSPLLKSSKSISPVQSLVTSGGKGKTSPRNANAEVVASPSSSLSDSPKQSVINAQKNSPFKFKSQNNTPKEKGSPSKSSPLKVWASVGSPNSNHASPLSRRKTSVDLVSVATTPSRSLRTQVTDKKVLSSGKKSSSYTVKRLSAGRSPSRSVSLGTPSRKTPMKIQKTNSASKVQSRHLSTPQLVTEETSVSTSASSEVNDPVESPNYHATTPRSTPKHQLDHEKLNSGNVSPSPRALKRMSSVKSPTHSLSFGSPVRRASGKMTEKSRSSTSKSKQPLLLKSDFYAQEVSKSEISEKHPGEVGENGPKSSQSLFSDQVMGDGTQTPSSGHRSKSRTVPKSSSKKQNLVADKILTPEAERPDDTKQAIAVDTSRMLRSPVTPKSTKKRVSGPLTKTPSVSSPETPGSKRKADFMLSSEFSKKTRLSTSPNSDLSTPHNKVSQRSPSSLIETKSFKELLSKSVHVTPAKNNSSTPSKSKVSPKHMPYKKKSVSPKSKNKTPVKISPGIKFSPSLLKENAKTPSSRNLAKSKLRVSSVKAKLATSTRASPLAKTPSSAIKVTPVTKKSLTKKVASTSRSLKKQGTSNPTRQARSPAGSVKKVFSVKKSNKKPLWTDIVRKGIMKKKTASKPKVVRSLLSNAVKTKKVLTSSKKKYFRMPVPTPNKRIASVTSTGHADSPETIIIKKRSSMLARIRMSHTKDLQSPSLDSGVATKFSDTSAHSSPLNSSVKNTKSLSGKKEKGAKRKSLLGNRKGTPDISPISTPNISQERFVSPLTTPRRSRQNNSLLAKFVLENEHVPKTVPLRSSRKSETLVGVKRLLKSRTPKADYSNVAGIKRLVRTPGASPKADYRDVRGVKRLVQTPKDSPKADYRDVRGVRRLVQTPRASPKADYRNVQGVRKLVQTPKDSPKADYSDVRGIRRLVQTPKESPKADYRNVSGVKNLLQTPAAAKQAVSQAKTVSIKQLYQNHTPPADYTKVKGVKQLFRVTRPIKGKARERKTKNAEVVRESDFTNVEGVKQLFREPEENEFNISGLQQLFSPVSAVSYGAKSDIVSPTGQEASQSTVKISSPKSRRKQSFGSPSSVTNVADNNKLQTASPIPQANAFAVDHAAEVDGVVVSPSKVKENSHKVTETLGSASKASTSVRNASATPTEQVSDLLQSPLRRKSAGSVVPSGSPVFASASGKSPKVRQEKSMTSPLHSVMAAASPSKTPPKTRHRLPAQSSRDENHDIKDSQSPKQKRKDLRKVMKSDVEANKTESSALQNVSSASTPKIAKKGKKVTRADKTPEIITISDDDLLRDVNDVVVGQQKSNRGGRSAKTTTRHKAAAIKGYRKDVGQAAANLIETQQVVSELSSHRSNRAMRSQTPHSAEVPRENEIAPALVSAVDSRATRRKASDMKKRGDGQDATEAESVSTRSKNGTATEHSEEQVSDLHQVGGRTSRRKGVVSLKSVGHSRVFGISSPKADKQIKEDSPQLIGSELIEIKSPKQTRRKGQAAKVVKKAASQSVVSSDNEHESGRVTRRGVVRQTRTRQNPLPEADSSELHAEDVSSHSHVPQSHDLANMKPLLRKEKESTTPSKRAASKQKQDSLTGDGGEMLVCTDHAEAIVGTPSSARSRKTRRNQKPSVNSEDNTNVSSITALEVAVSPEMSTRSKKKIFSKSEHPMASSGEFTDGGTSTPDMSKQPRLRRNHKASQENKTTSCLHEGDSSTVGTRRSKRGHPQESKNIDNLSKRSRTQVQKHVSPISTAEYSSTSIDPTDAPAAVSQSVKGKAVKIDTFEERTEAPHTKRPKRQVKKSSADKEDNTSFQKDVNETLPVSKENRPVRSIAVKGEQKQIVVQDSLESERPKRVGRATRGVSNTSTDDSGVKTLNSRRSRAKRGASDSVNDVVSPKRNRREVVTEEGANVIEKITKKTKVQTKSVKTRAPVLEAIPEVEEEVMTTPTVTKKVTRAKASTKQNVKKSPLRRQTRSRKK